MASFLIRNSPNNFRSSAKNQLNDPKGVGIGTLYPVGFTFKEYNEINSRVKSFSVSSLAASSFTQLTPPPTNIFETFSYVKQFEISQSYSFGGITKRVASLKDYKNENENPQNENTVDPSNGESNFSGCGVIHVLLNQNGGFILDTGRVRSYRGLYYPYLFFYMSEPNNGLSLLSSYRERDGVDSGIFSDFVVGILPFGYNFPLFQNLPNLNNIRFSVSTAGGSIVANNYN